MKRTIKITIADLDAAIAAEWSARTCVLAQAVMRETGDRIEACHNSGVATNKRNLEVENEISVVRVFDSQFGANGARDYDKVAELLPCEVEFIQKLRMAAQPTLQPPRE